MRTGDLPGPETLERELMSMRDPYAVLGVRRNAGADEIKAAWRQVAKAVHPDQNRNDPNAAARFAEAGRAYEVLKNPALRNRYDQARREAELRRMEEEKRRSEPDPVDAETAEEAMNRIFAADQARRSAAQSPPQAASQATSQAAASQTAGPQTAPPPTGAGSETPRADKAAEPTGNGTGANGPGGTGSGAEAGDMPGVAARAGSQAAELMGSLLRRFGVKGGVKATDKVPDILCEATVTIEDILRRRKAETVLPDGQVLKVAIPEGTTEGSEIRLKGEGFRMGALRGDLVVRVRVAREPRFSLEGFDLHALLTLPLQDAVLGTETVIEAPTGKVRVSVPAWSGAGRQIRIEDHGLADGAGGRGALVVELAITLSDQPDPRLLDLMKSQRDGLVV